MTILEWFQNNFSDFDPSQVEGMEYLGKASFDKVRLASSKSSSLLQYWCCGDVIVSFHFPNTRAWPILFVRDDEEGKKWDSELYQKAARGEHGQTQPKPFAKLKLVQTA